jgi:magnesium chelatase family protein
MPAMAGGGSNLRPGEVALAHHGVLCLPDAPEFERRVLDALRQPLQDGEIIIARGGALARFPARFILLAAMQPCPCGDPAGCSCTPARARRYQERLTGTLGTWIPLHLTVDPPTFTGTTSENTDTASAARVAGARDRMRHRLAGTPWRVNGDSPHAELRCSWPPDAAGLAVIEHAVDLGVVSGLAAGRVTGVAWTLADLAGKPRPGAGECARELGRLVMAVPGPVTSSQSAGCYQLIGDAGAACVTSAADVLTQVSAAAVGDLG